MQDRPISSCGLLELFDALHKTDCKHDFCHTRNFLKENKLDEKKILNWLQECGAHCDCEVFSNVDRQANKKW